MAEPARVSAADPGPDKARPRKSDPLSPGWVNVRGLLCTAAEGAQLAVTELTARPDCPGAKRRAELLLAALSDLAEITRRCVLDEAVLEAVRADAYARGVADCKAARSRLGAVPGPH